MKSMVDESWTVDLFSASVAQSACCDNQKPEGESTELHTQSWTYSRTHWLTKIINYIKAIQCKYCKSVDSSEKITALNLQIYCPGHSLKFGMNGNTNPQASSVPGLTKLIMDRMQSIISTHRDRTDTCLPAPHERLWSIADRLADKCTAGRSSSAADQR